MLNNKKQCVFRMGDMLHLRQHEFIETQSFHTSLIFLSDRKISLIDKINVGDIACMRCFPRQLNKSLVCI